MKQSSFQEGIIASPEEVQNIIDEVFNVKQKAEELINDHEQVKTKIALLEEYPERLKKFYCATVENAIATCNDTQLLKELLEIVS